jgi:hypothetical protein
MEADRGDPDDRGSEPRLLSFLTNYLTRSTEQDADVPRENVDSTIMKSFINWFYCSPNGKDMAGDVAPQINQQMIMQRDFHMDTYNRPFQYVVNVILRIIMISASGASAERVFWR